MTQQKEERVMASLMGGDAQAEAYVHMIRSSVQMLMLVPVEAFEEMARSLDRVEGIGPFIDPTAFTKPGAWDALRSNKRLAAALLNARRELEKIKAEIPLP